MFEQLSIFKAVTSYSQKFINDNIKRLTKKVFDNNIKNQYSTTKTIITNFVEKFLKNDASTKRNLSYFNERKKK